MVPLELGEGSKTHVQSAVVFLCSLESEGFKFSFDICGKLSRRRKRFRGEEGCPGGDGTRCGRVAF